MAIRVFQTLQELETFLTGASGLNNDKTKIINLTFISINQIILVYATA